MKNTKVVIVHAGDLVANGKITYIKSFNDLITIKEKYGHDLIISDNPFYKDSPSQIHNLWKEISLEKAKELSTIEYEIMIYDDYIE